MAKSQKEMKGWDYILADDEVQSAIKLESGSPIRRSRRNTPIKASSSSTNLKLKRKTDDLVLQVGDVVLVNNKRQQKVDIVLIKEIQFGVQNFIDLGGAFFIQMKNVNFKDLPKVAEYRSPNDIIPNEIFISPLVGYIKVTDIIDKIRIISESELENIILDDSNSDSTFLCRRGCDLSADHFSEKFDFRELHLSFQKDPNEVLKSIRSQTVPSAYKASTKKTQPVVKAENKVPKKKQSDKVIESVEIDDSEDDDSDLDDDVKPEDLLESDDGDLELDDDSESESPSKASRKRKSIPSTPTKRKMYVRNKQAPILSPLKKRIKIKSENSRENLPIPTRKVTSTLPPIESSSDAFKKMKEKLHTSARLADLPCRENEFTTIYMNLESAINEKTGCCIYVSGTPGVGKTATIREVVGQLQEGVQDNIVGDFDYLEINGLKLLTPNVSYEILWEKISGLKVSASNAALLLEDYFKNEKNDKSRKPLVVLMDELDQIVTAKQNVMYNFFNWPTYPNSNLIVLAVANTMDLPERVLSNKISSRLGLRRIQFIGYTFQQLGEIIANRLIMFTKESKRNVILHPDAIGFASRKVAGVSGDARRALNICRRAVEIAENEFLQLGSTERGSDEPYVVLIGHISKAINETINSPTSQFIASLPFTSKLVLVGVLLRMKRSGLAENPLGSVIDEVKNSLLLLTSTDETLQQLEKWSIVDLLYKGNDGETINIRPYKFKHIITELVENGILMQQSVRSERHKLIHLNVSQDEVLSVLKTDQQVSNML